MFRMRHADGRWIWLRARAELVDRDSAEPHLIGIAVDVTEQMRLVERSKTADIRLRDAIETISEAFVLWDADNRLVMCNSKYQQLHGIPDAALAPGTPYADVIAAGRKPLVRSQIVDRRTSRKKARAASNCSSRTADGCRSTSGARRTAGSSRSAPTSPSSSATRAG